jgi:hypothetical protein
MKKCGFLLGLILMLGSCEQTYYSVPVTNGTTKTVRFSYNGSTDTLAPSKSKVYSVAAYTQPPVLLGLVPEGPRSVGRERYDEGYTFVDLDSIPLNVVNTLPFDITIKSDDFIDDGNGKTSLLVEASTTNTDGKIYTSQPKFTVVPQGYSAQVTYTITGGTMYVTVR